MRVFELYTYNNEILLAYNENSSKRIFKGFEVYKLMDFLSKKSIKKVNDNEIDKIIEYEDCVLIIRDYPKLSSLKVLETIPNIGKMYYEKEKLKKVKGKKVQRKNKHQGLPVKIVSGALAAVFLYLIIPPIKGRTEKIEVPNPPKTEFSQTIDIDVDPGIFQEDIEVDIPQNIQIINEEVIPQNIQVVNEEVIPQNTIEENNNDALETVSIDYNDREDKYKINNTSLKYGQLIERYSNIYGLDPTLVTAIAAQERGEHSSITDSGGATGLMQIQNGFWVGKELTAYNFELGDYETIIVDRGMIEDLSGNIKLGCMILQNALKYMNYNILAAIQCYNMGSGNMQNILRHYAAYEGKDVKAILNDKSDLGWLDYRYVPGQGDKNYIENVLSWIGPRVNINIKRVDGSITHLSVTNEPINKKVY